MSNLVEIKVPDIGDFKDVGVIEILVKVGDAIAKEDALVTLESDKATMEIPAPQAGVVHAIHIAVGDSVSEGSQILTLQTDAAAQPEAGAVATAPPPPAQPSVQAVAAAAPVTTAGARAILPDADLQAEVLVLGAGPGGYTAAFRAADLGKKVVLVERYPTLGGVCLNVGCIPSKALLHVAKVMTEAHELSSAGIDFGLPKIDVDKLRGWKDQVVARLTGGLAGLAKQRKVTVVQGIGEFAGPNLLNVRGSDGEKRIAFEHAIVAAGSQVARIPGLPYDDPRLLDSTSALTLPKLNARMLVIGGGIIGLEMATVYDALGARISVVELMDGLIPGCDRDLVRPLAKRIGARYEAICLKTKVARVDAQAEGLLVSFDGEQAPAPQLYDQVLVAVGRRPNGRSIGAEHAGIVVNERGYIPVDRQQRTNVAHIYAIGDIVGEPMLAHKATHEGKIAAEVICGHKAAFDALTIPSVAYTDPELAWMGLTETQAKAQGVAYDKAVFPWAASGRALATGRDEGSTKLLYDPATKRVLGAGMVGPNAGELIAEAVLALEMGADVEDIALTIHPHPTLSETLFFAAEIAEGSITDLYLPKR